MSLTSRTAMPVADVETLTAMRPPTGLYLIALSTRFSSACRSTIRSPRHSEGPAGFNSQGLLLFLSENAELCRDFFRKFAEVDAIAATAWTRRYPRETA